MINDLRHRNISVGYHRTHPVINGELALFEPVIFDLGIMPRLSLSGAPADRQCEKSNHYTFQIVNS